MRLRLTVLALFLSLPLGSLPARAQGIPVVDGRNLVQNIMTALESVAQTQNQIRQYQAQLQQYENQLQNTLAPSSYTWDQASRTMNQLRQSIDTLNYYKTQLGSLENYLAQFQDVTHYRNSPCFQSSGCTSAQRMALDENRRLAAQAQKKANDGLLRGLDQQQQALESDAATLQRLQTLAQGASGQMQAIGYANQLVSQQSNQLLQIRGLLIAQQNAMVTKMQAEADLEAKQQAAGATSRESRIERTATPRNWLEMTR
jgi:P-type conjugative transfer protein TrbJ